MAGKPSIHERLVLSLAIVLQDKRISLKITQRQLASTSKLNRSYVSDVENGRRNISIKNLSRLAHALRTKPSLLLAAAEEKLFGR